MTTADLLAVGRDAHPISGIVIPSGAYNAADPTPVEFDLLGAQALTAVTEVTAISGSGATVDVNVEGYDPSANDWVTVMSASYKTLGIHSQSTDPRGAAKVYTASNPAAGADLEITVPTAKLWIVKSVIFTLATDANAANRNPELQYRDAADNIFGSVTSNQIVASQTGRFAFEEGVTAQGTAFNATPTLRSQSALPLRDTRLSPGMKIVATSINKQVGDQISAVVYSVVEQVPAMFRKMRVRPVKSGTTTTLTYSVGVTAN